MSGSRHICCVISDLGVGGAQRVMSLLANEWVARGHDVTLVTLGRVGVDAYGVDSRVHRVALGVETESQSIIQAIRHNLRKVTALRRSIKELAADIVISFVDKTNVIAALSCIGRVAPVIVSERTHPPNHSIGRAWSLLRRITYRLADAIVVQSEVTRQWVSDRIPRVPVHVIRNPIARQFSNDERGLDGRQPIVLGVGRFGPEKGFDVLIEAFARIARKHAEWSMVLVGAGPLDASLKSLAARRLPGGNIRFTGVVKDPERFYRTAGLFVMPSRYEGFPNALLEAMACGCAVIATNCPGGTPEIVEHGYDGLLVGPDDIEQLARTMDELMADPARRGRLALGAKQSTERFKMDKIMSAWDLVFSNLSEQRSRTKRLSNDRR